MGKYVWEVGRLALWGASIVTFFGAQRCSSLCSQSEGREGCGDSTVAHFARKVRGANVGAQHELKIQQSHAPERWSCSLRVRDPHFASKVSYSASPQSLAAQEIR